MKADYVRCTMLAVAALSAAGGADIESIRKETLVFRTEIDRLKRELVRVEGEGGVRSSPGASARTDGARRYIMAVQPSSMVYYDWCGHYWAPGPASVVYCPDGGAEAAPARPAYAAPPAPARPAYIPPPPTRLLPPPEQPPVVPEKKVGNADDASHAFWVGYRSYWQGDYDRALASFDAAVRIDDQDARFWYYKALAERALGDAAKAETSAQRGRELHAAHKPKADVVGAALERVQGQERRFLNAPEVVGSEGNQDR